MTEDRRKNERKWQTELIICNENENEKEMWINSKQHIRLYA